MHTVPYYERPIEIAAPVVQRPDPVPTVEGNEYLVDKILKHGKRGRGYQFLTIMKGAPTHDAEWQPSCDCYHTNGTINEEFLNYVKKNNILNR